MNRGEAPVANETEHKFSEAFRNKHLEYRRLGRRFVVYGHNLTDLSREDLMALVVKLSKSLDHVYIPPHLQKMVDGSSGKNTTSPK